MLLWRSTKNNEIHTSSMKIALSDADLKLAETDAQTFVKLVEHGSMSVEYYQPRKVDLQTPHKQDELYMITSGTGEFIKANERFNFKAGDVFFVPAGVIHRFENFTEDFATWVIFYGINGGEKSS